MIDELQLERRLRRIAEPPRPAVPAEITEYVRRLPLERRRETLRASRRRVASSLLGLAASLALLAGGIWVWSSARQVGIAPAESGQWTGLEFSDITATAPTGGIISVANYRGGSAAVTRDGRLWTTTDGINWSVIDGAPNLVKIERFQDGLLGQRSDVTGACRVPGPPQGAVADGTCPIADALYASDDAIDWRKLDVPFGQSQLGQWVTGAAGVLMDVGNENWTMTGNGPQQLPSTDPNSGIWASADGSSWSRLQPPAGAETGSFFLQVTRAGMLAGTTVPSPTGDRYAVSTDGTNVPVATKWWRSTGGPWTVYEPRASEPVPTRQGFGPEPLADAILNVLSGRDGDESIYFPIHSPDGFTWSADEQPPVYEGPSEAWMMPSTDGVRILFPTVDGKAPNVALFVSFGGGRWQRLQLGGNVGDLPRDGGPDLVTGGVLWAGQSRVLFGRPVSGVDVRDDVRLGPTSSPFPTQTPQPRSSASLPPLAPFTSATATKVVGGPVGADWVESWPGGYVAARHGTGGTTTFWTSRDASSWTQVPAATFGTERPGAVVRCGDKVVIYGGGTWTSTDGQTWSAASWPPLHVGDGFAAGNSYGTAFVMDDPQFSVAVTTDCADWPWLPHLDGVSIGDLKAAAANESVYVVGGYSGSQADAMGRTPDSANAATAWWSADGATWQKATVEGGAGIGFVRIVAARDGFVALGAPKGAGSPTSVWWSKDGRSWRQTTPANPFGVPVPIGDIHFAGDGTRMLAYAVIDGQLEIWSSTNGSTWASFRLAGDTSFATSGNVRVFPLADGALIVTDQGVWAARIGI